MESRAIIPVPSRQALSAGERAGLCLMFLASIFVAVAALPGAAPAQSSAVAIVFPPWVSGEDAIARSLSAGYPVLRSGRSAFVVIAAPVESGGARAVRPQGAVLVLGLAGLAGCLDARVTDVTA